MPQNSEQSEQSRNQSEARFPISLILCTRSDGYGTYKD